MLKIKFHLERVWRFLPDPFLRYMDIEITLIYTFTKNLNEILRNPTQIY